MKAAQACLSLHLSKYHIVVMAAMFYGNLFFMAMK